MSVYVPVELQRAVRARFSSCCAYCHTAESLSIAIFEFEHILPRSAGGTTDFENLCFSDHDAPLFHPVRDQWADHFSWSEDASTIVALTATGRATVAALRMNRPVLIRLRRMWAAMAEHPPDLD